MGDQKHLLYVMGEPGIGKSTVVRALKGEQAYEDYDHPFYFRRYDCGVVELGADRVDYPGTDSLGLDAQPKVVKWIEAIRPDLVLGEGDRLGNGAFFDAMAGLGYRLWLYHLEGEDLAAARRAQRGSHQDEAWIKGRRTKFKDLSIRFGAQDIRSSLPPHLTARLFQGPVAQAFRD